MTSPEQAQETTEQAFVMDMSSAVDEPVESSTEVVDENVRTTTYEAGSPTSVTVERHAA